MQQLPLPFEDFKPGWQGKRYLLCSDDKWHLVLKIYDGLVADVQCCELVTVILPVPSDDGATICVECSKLQFFNPKKGAAAQTA